MQSLHLLLMALCLVAGPVRAEGPNTDVERLGSILQTERDKSGARAVLFGMWVGDREILTTALGDSMTTVPASTDMHYRIGGITETFQATLTMMLAEQGRLSLDDKLSRWYPDLPGADRVTVRMLLANRAGYPDYVRVKDFLDRILRDPFQQLTPDDLIGYAVRDGKLAYPAGTSQAYSHTEYVLLGQVIEKATGQSMKDLYQQNILSPLGLADTRFPTDQNIQAPVLHSFSQDRGVYEDATYFNPSWAGATGALTSNLHDLGRWGPIFGTGKLLQPESFREMTAPTSVGMGRNRPDLYFAYGFVVSNGWFVQNPSMNGYNGAFAYHPTHGVTLVVECTMKPDPTVDPAGIHIVREVIRYVTPDTPLTF
ncbi:MAG: serine hydrolase domain-containing protein [Candidatus Eremiobacterota bacterium]